MQDYVIQRVYDRATFYNSLQHQLLRQYAAAASARVSSHYTLAGASVELTPAKVPCVENTNYGHNFTPVIPAQHFTQLPMSLQDSLHNNIITIDKYHKNKAHFNSGKVHHSLNTNNNTNNSNINNNMCFRP